MKAYCCRFLTHALVLWSHKQFCIEKNDFAADELNLQTLARLMKDDERKKSKFLYQKLLTAGLHTFIKLFESGQDFSGCHETHFGHALIAFCREQWFNDMRVDNIVQLMMIAPMQ